MKHIYYKAPRPNTDRHNRINQAKTILLNNVTQGTSDQLTNRGSFAANDEIKSTFTKNEVEINRQQLTEDELKKIDGGKGMSPKPCLVFQYEDRLENAFLGQIPEGAIVMYSPDHQSLKTTLKINTSTVSNIPEKGRKVGPFFIVLYNHDFFGSIENMRKTIYSLKD